jgi:hypothetical protein
MEIVGNRKLKFMKILFTRKQIGPDYLSDQVFHGLSQFTNIEVIDSDRLWYMYRHEFEPVGPNKLEDQYGRGFTCYGLLKEPAVDRTEIKKQIQNHYFDLVILSRVDDHLSPWKDLIFQYYSPEEIIVLDGDDGTDIKEHLLDKCCLYYKRELVSNREEILPISFAIPKIKCLEKFPNKIRAWSNVIPGPSGYTGRYPYRYENDYYRDYQESLFGLTRKKGGWDCMRHYEILANRCIPYFWSLEDAPKTLMTTLPVDLLINIKRNVDLNGAGYYLPQNAGWQQYCDWENQLYNHFINNCTTEHLAKYVLNNWLYRKNDTK